jgi:hypothetical protein
VAKNLELPSWVPPTIPADHHSGFKHRTTRPCERYEHLALSCGGHVEMQLWQVTRSNGSLSQSYKCLQCGESCSSPVKQIPQVRPRTDKDYEQIAADYQHQVELAAAEFSADEDQSYDAYLRSPEWSAIRDRILALDNHRCRVCGGTATAVHHRTYEDYRTPRDEDLVSLCRGCHEAVHCLNPYERGQKGIYPEWPGHTYRSRTT